MKIISIVGARPQFIKCSSLSQELRAEHVEVIVHTGQHYDLELSGIFFGELEIPKPDYDLGVGSGTHGYQTSQMLIKIEEVLLKEKPELVLVYGDTNTTLAGALATSKLHIPLGHIEAGLRSKDRNMPEEINRILVDHCSDLLFCPNKTSVNNLIKENISTGVHRTGDVMVDLLLRQKEVAEKSNVLQDLSLRDKQYFVVTVHRAGNTDDPQNLKNIVDALCRIDKKIVFPIHPRTEKALKEYSLYARLSEHKTVKIVKPLGYHDMVKIMNHAQKIITDSGGMEKEAYVLKVPCITLLDVTPWEVTVEDGWNVLVGANTEKIVNMARDFEPSGEQTEDFGKGQACKNIKHVIDSMMK
jgi:UDP-GlcNAc3NAcA epimerase